jgi:hypothetical protein
VCSLSLHTPTCCQHALYLTTRHSPPPPTLCGEGRGTVVATFNYVVLIRFAAAVVLSLHLIKYASYHNHLLWDMHSMLHSNVLRDQPSKVYEVKNQIQINTRVYFVQCLSRLCVAQTLICSVLKGIIAYAINNIYLNHWVYGLCPTSGLWTKPTKPAIPSLINHHQNPLESTWHTGMTICISCYEADILRNLSCKFMKINWKFIVSSS